MAEQHKRPVLPIPLAPAYYRLRGQRRIQAATLLHDFTAQFCNHYFDLGDDTYKQMTLAARSVAEIIAQRSEREDLSRDMKMNYDIWVALGELRTAYSNFLK